MNSVVMGIARNTFKEGVRDRLFAIIGVFAGVVIVSTLIIAPLSLGEQVRITQDLGLGAISVLSFIIVVLVGTNIVHREIEKRTIYTVLSKPVERWQFILGKFTGLAATITLLVGSMTLLLIVVNLAVSRAFNPQLLVAVLLTWMELLLLVALSVLMSTLASPILGAILSLLLYVIGHTIADVRDLATAFGTGSLKLVTDVIYYAVPNLEYLNVRSKVTHGVPVDVSYIAFASSYALAYATVFLVLAVLAFDRKEFK